MIKGWFPFNILFKYNTIYIPGKSGLQEFCILANFIHKQIKILLYCIGLLKEDAWYYRWEQCKGSVIHNLLRG